MFESCDSSVPSALIAADPAAPPPDCLRITVVMAWIATSDVT